ncbi:MAG: hypothetical protein ACO3RW_08470 [Burkholderiaceae bacterium]
MANVVKLHPAADPDEVLRAADGIYESVVILGWTKDGGFSGRASLNLETADALLLVEIFRTALINEAIE